MKKRRRLSTQTVGRTIVAIGKEARVRVDSKMVVDKEGKEKEQPIFASAHDLRRSFGERWSSRIMPKLLMELMRHESVETTMRRCGITWGRMRRTRPIHFGK